MLIVGLGTEAVLFLLFAFAPIPHEPDWSLVYPQLSDDYVPEEDEEAGRETTISKLDNMLEKGKVDGGLIEKLGRGMNNLAESASKIGDMANATVATTEYAKNVKAASTSMAEMNKSYGITIQAMGEMANATQDAKGYHTQVQNITKNLSALNAVYELELKDADSHLKAMNKFYSNLSGAMDNMAEASKNTEIFRTQLTQLTGNLTQLNGIYGKMLTAMKGA
jgi:gliding motility-associated protein GldL